MGSSPWSRLRSASLGVKMVVFSALLSAIMVSVTFLALSVTIRSHTRDLIAQTLAQHQRMLADLQARNLESLVRASTLMSENPTLLAAMETYRMESVEGEEARDDLMETIQIEARKIAVGLESDVLIVTDPAGAVLARSGIATDLPGLGEDLSTHSVIRYAMTQNNPVGERNYSVIGLHGRRYQVGSVPIVLRRFIIGTLTLGERIDQGFVDSLQKAFDSEVIVLAGEEILGSTLPPSRVRAAALPELGHSEHGENRQGSVSVEEIGGEEYVAVPLSLGRTDQGGEVTLHLLRSLTGALSGSNRSLLLTLSGYGFFMVMVSVLAASLVSRSVLRPLESLVSFMRSSAGSGDRSGRFRAPGAGTEVQVLADSFNELMASLQEHEKQLIDKAQEELERLERLKESEKLAALGRMLSGAAHEINNPMTGVIGHVELLLARQDLDEKVRKRLEEVRKQGHRIVELTRNLLKVARRDTGVRAPVDIHQVLLDTAALRKRDYERAGIALDLHLSPTRIRLMGSELELSQVFLNIINNAFDALKEAGGERKLVVSAEETTEGVHIVFADDGPGLKDPSQVFEHFYTTKPPGQGTGLGLGISQAIVESHGGQITASNRPEGGACFTLDLPRGDWSAAAKTPVATIPTGGARESLPASILVVDDEPVVRELQMAILDSLGAKAVSAASGSEAIEHLRRHDFDLIVTDLLVEGDVTGEALYEWVTQHRRSGAQGVVFVTADASGEATFLDNQRLRSLRKPFEMDEYISVLREAWNEVK